MKKDIKEFKKLKWEDVKPGQKIWIAGNLNELGKPTVCYGPHTMMDPGNFQIKSGSTDALFYERWSCLYVPKREKKVGNYYDRELQLIAPKKGKKPNIKIKLLGNESMVTRWLDLNLDSIESFQAFIDILKEALEEEPEEPKITDPCPDCGTQLRAKGIYEGGGVECPNPKCYYWFCY